MSGTRLNNSHVALLLTSLVQGWLSAAIEKRIEHLGGPDKAKIKQGVLCRVDPAVDELERSIDALYAPMPGVLKGVEKSIVKLADSPGGESIYDLAAVVVDETDRMIDGFINGDAAGVGFGGGWRAALDEMERLMLTRKMGREQAIEVLRKRYPLPTANNLKAQAAADAAAA